jgi:hypothetical protein
MQNTSHAVMARRFETKDSLDDFPTPPWATRALIEYAAPGAVFRERNCLEPACGRGYMANTLAEYFGSVVFCDAADYGVGFVQDFLSSEPPSVAFDWIITNPPIRLAEEFALRALEIAREGVALLVRTQFLEGVGRHERLFSKHLPERIAQFSERVPMVKGRLDPKASTATSYAWIVWDATPDHPSCFPTDFVWIPPCRKRLERDGDYDAPILDKSAARAYPEIGV